MSDAGLVRQALSGVARASWMPESLRLVASQQVSDEVLGLRGMLLRADVHTQWMRWFVDGLVDPRRHFKTDWSYPVLYADVFSAVGNVFPEVEPAERLELASDVAGVLRKFITSLLLERKRRAWSREHRFALIDLAGRPPRCWVCGIEFDRCAILNFLQVERQAIPLPRFVDVLKPIGLLERDLTIEVDHVDAFSEGGEEGDNLRLACGWCNRHKGALSSIYDVEGRARNPGRNTLGIWSLPQPFWVVRILGTQRTCEHIDGCEAGPSNSEMTIAPINRNGALNPTNLSVVCRKHDPLGAARLQPPEMVRSIWSTN